MFILTRGYGGLNIATEGYGQPFVTSEPFFGQGLITILSEAEHMFNEVTKEVNTKEPTAVLDALEPLEHFQSLESLDTVNTKEPLKDFDYKDKDTELDSREPEKDL